MGVVDQSWVTVALTDALAEKAIVLAKSLRNSATTRRLSVIFSKNVSDKMKNVLLRTFDQCLRLDHSHELNGISEELYAKLLLWNLPFLKKCIFLHPDVLVLKNSDELFGFPGISAPLNSIDELETGLLIVEPSFTAHEKLMEWMEIGKHEAEEDMMQRYSKWMQQQTSFSALPGKYYVSITPGEKPVALMESAVSILRFQNGHPLDLKNGSHVYNGANTGIFERAVYAFYEKLYHESFGENAMLLELEPLPTVSRTLLDNGQEPIAIIGMSCRFPMANTVDEYWDVLVNGKDCIRRVPEDRWPSATDEDFRGIQAGFLKCPVDEFDGKFFNISPFELTHMDPQQRLLLEVTWEALEDAGINPQTLRGTQTAVYLGTWLQDYRELIRNDQGEFSDFHRTYLGNSLGGSGGRLSFFLGLTGPNIATESGCSSGMAALVLSCEALRKGRSDMALAAGANLLLYPFQKKHMVNVVSPDGRCKTFDESADGFGRAEGVATLVLKRYSDALKSGDNVLALIRGCGISQEGTSRSLGTPTKEVQEIAMKVALEDAGISPTDVTYVEAHGTGTPVGDPIELAAISSIYCKNLERKKPLFVASGKTMIGHTESCSGLAGVIKVILSMKNEVIPPHLHLQNLNPHIRIEDLPLEIPTSAVKWEKIPGKPRFAGVSSFGITGTDSHVIIQEPPEYNPPKLSLDVEDRPLHLLTFSGKSETALNDVLTSFTSFLESNQEDVNLADAGYTLNDGRAHFMHRVAVTASSTQDLLKKIKTAEKGSKLIPETQPKLCFLFTGQGSQYVGMAKTLYETNAVFKMHFDQCDKLLQDMFQLSIKPVIWGQVESDALHRTMYSQTCIFCIEYCIFKLWESWGIKPDAVLGHSLGEFAATVAAGILNFEDALKLVAVRSKLVETMCKEGKMIVIKADEKTVNGFRQEFVHNNKNSWLDFAAVNSSDQTVLAGPPSVVDAFAMYCTERNLKVHILDATNAFHSRDMDDIISEYEKVTQNIKPPTSAHSSVCTYFSGLKGVACQTNEINSDYWIQHSRDRVRFMDACKVAYEDGCRIFLEVGPQPILCALTMKNISGESEYEEPITVLPSIRRKENEWATLLETLTKLYQLGFPVDWKGFDQFYNRRKIKLPTYPFNRKKHWFESKDKKRDITLNGKSLHPLLGCQIPNATTSSIFQSTIELDKLSYLKDHAIGGQVVFPAAGFLEVALKSGNLSTIGEINADEDLMNPISIEKLMIEAPLGLYENEPCQMQTVVMKMESAENKVSIYTQQRNSGTNDGGMASVKWIRQASGTFVPLQASVVQQNNESLVTDSLQVIKERCTHEIDTNEFYEKLTTVGLEFGTTFKSLGKVWRNSKDKNEILTQVLYPNNNATDGNNNQIIKSTTSSNKSHYICHPVVLDALIQTIMLGKEDDVKKLQLFVPVLIDKMIVLSKADFSNASADSSSLPELYAHCRWEANQGVESRSAILYSASGKVLAIMSGVQMIQTTSEVILKTLNNQQLVVPDMYEEIWVSKNGPFKNRANLSSLGEDIFRENSSPEIDNLNLLDDKERKTMERRNKFVYYYILKAFYELGWKPSEMLGETFTVERFMEQLGILKSYTMLTQRYLEIFAEEGILETTLEQHIFKMIKLPSSERETESVLEQLTLESEKEETVDFKVIQACGEKLKGILAGKISALSILFPEEKGSTVSAETYYYNSFMVPKFNATIYNVFHQIIQRHASLPEEERGVLRILEVGAGTGSSTKVVLPILAKFATRFEYTVSDISPVFENRIKEMFKDVPKGRMHYRILNIEKDPLSPGFTPQYYDIVFASNVLHATQSLSESVRNARMLLKDNGFLILGETMKAIRDFDIIFALLDSYWRFTDFDIRSSYPCVGSNLWKKVFLNEGFDQFKEHLAFEGRLAVLVGKAKSNYNFDTLAKAYSIEEKSKWWLVFSSLKRYRKYFQHRMERFGRKVLLVSMAEQSESSASFVEVSRNHFEVRAEAKENFQKLFSIIKERELSIEGILYLWGLEPETEILRRTHGFLFLSQILLSDFKGLPRLIVPTEGIIRIDDESATDISPASLCGMAKTLRTEHFNLHVKSIDLDIDEMDENVKYDELLTELWNDDNEFQIAYRQRNRHVARLVTCKDFASPLPLPKCDRFSLLLPKVTKNIADLKFCPNGKSPLKENEIEVKVRAYGLNFRDVFTVLKPNEEFEKWNTVGLEFSGTVVSIGDKVTKWKTGDYVIGCNFAGGALPSHLSMEEDMVFAMPDQLTFCEAATIPAAFATVYYCLVMIADLKRGEWVLIHAGSGGVGLFAIQVAKALGANIIATAGSRRKRTFLRNLGISHVFHSRNTDYGKQILTVTRGEGVHVVLNSLTSPGFKEASLGCCAKGARFVEMSRLHIWTPEEVQKLRPDVKYSAVDLTKVDRDVWQAVWRAVDEYMERGHLNSIPFIQYDATCIREALTYMQKAKHIGKIIITMPDMILKENEQIPHNPLFSDRATYLVTGGLGGIGMELVKWMCELGGKHLVLTSRSSPDERAVKIINDLNSKGYHIVPLCLDIGDYQQCKKLLSDISDPELKLPKLRGIFHLAGCLSDATFTNQTLDMYKSCFQGKVYGALNLHNLTRDYNLEFFNMFSSMVSTFGPIGQSNYAAANNFLDALAHHRCSIGICGQSINWGQWGEVGLSKDIKVPAMRPFSPTQGLSALEIVMRSQKTQVCVFDVDFTVVRKLTANIGSFLEELKLAKETQSVAFDVKINNFWEDFNGAEDETGKEQVIKSYVCQILRQILKLEEDEIIDENQKFSDMGMDSLMMLEMKNFLQTMLGKNITMNVSELAELTTINKLSSHLMGLIKTANNDGGESEIKQDEEEEDDKSYNFFTPSQKSLIEEDMVLPEHIRATSNVGAICKRSEIKTVLLTGSTGKLGPYMLEALASRPLQKIICLIRSKDDTSARDRLIKVLKEKNLAIDLSRVECVAGDITEGNLSLSQEKYDELATTVDAVVHVAVKGNLMEPYKKKEENIRSDLRSVNVIGTRNVLEFSAKGKTKHVLHASTLLACHKVAPNGLLLEDWCHPQDVFEMPNVGYPISKFICEILTKQAVERGIPVHVHRFPALSGDKNGCFSFPNNHAMLRLLGFCKLGILPANPVPLQLLAVDYAAQLSAQIFFNDAPSDVYNITNPHTCLLQDFPTLAQEFDFKIDVVEYEEFIQKLQQNDEYASLFPYRKVDFDGGRFVDFTTSPVLLQSWINNPEHFFVSEKLQRFLPDYEKTEQPMDILRHDMQFAKDTNIFKRFGL